MGGTDGRHSVRGQPSKAPAPRIVLVRLSHLRHTRLVQLLNAEMPIDFRKPLIYTCDSNFEDTKASFPILFTDVGTVKAIKEFA